MRINTELKTIVIIISSPINEDIIKRIGFHSFKKKMNIIIFDCLPWIRKKVIPNNLQYLNFDIITIKDYIDFNQLKQNISQLNFINKQEYYDYASENNLELKPEIKYNKYWINWYNFLGTDITIFPENKKEWLKYCKEYKIISEKKYMKKYMKYNLPSMPEELYKEFGIIDNELKKNIISTKKKIDL